jgi:hypothetical protein
MPRDVRTAATIGATVSGAFFTYMLFVGRWELAARRYTSDFYDSQARRLFGGRLSVELETFGLEAFRSGDGFQTYFGLFPALLRMPLLAITGRFDGRLTQPSMMCAFVVLMVAIAGLTWRIRQLVRGVEEEQPVDVVDLTVAAAMPALLGVGTVVLFLASATVVYHEAMLWGVAGALLAFDRLLIAVSRPTALTVTAFGLATAVAVLSRASVGFAPVIAATVTAIALTVVPGRGPDAWRRAAAWVGGGAGPALPARFAAGLLLAALAPVALHVAVNHARFGTLLSPPFADQVWTELSPDRRAALDANGGGLFNIAYTPSTLLAYLRPDGVDVARTFPFVHFPLDRPAVIGDATFDSRDRTASMSASSPLVALLAALGLVVVAGTRRLALLRPMVLGSLVAAGGVLTIAAIAHRYLGDLLPLVVVGTITGAFVCAAAAPSNLSWRRIAAVALFGLAAWTFWANVALALSYQRLFAPPRPSDRHAFLTTQLDIDGVLPGSIRYGEGVELPPDGAPAGALFVLGDCAELHWSDGNIWEMVEPTPRGATPLCDRLRRG